MTHAPTNFVHLHNHTEYSLLDGASRIAGMVKRAAELKMPALALTDHGVMYGAVHFYKACKQAGIKPILGCEVYVAPRSRHLKEGRADRDPYHLTLLAADAEGYLNLMRLCTAGQMEGLYYKPRIDREILAANSGGLIALSGCLGGEVATKFNTADEEGARETVATYKDIFGTDRYLLEVQRHGIKEQAALNEALVRYSSEFKLRLCATNDLHYVHAQDAEAHDVLLCLQTGANYDDPNRWRFEGKDFYLKTAAEMAELFNDLPQALAATLEVADQVDVKIRLGESLLPPFEVPDGITADQYLRRMAEAGVSWRYGDRPEPAVKDRLDLELDVISQTGYASYFLIVWDFYRFARQSGIAVGPGRGSAVGSVVSYCLGITNLDPLAHGLIFERFLNKDRVSMPDIDCDFSVEGRERVIRYVSEKYGSDRVAQIVTFTTMASKAAIRDVGRVLNVPLKECDRLSKLVPVYQGRSKSLEDAIKEVPEFREAYESGPELKRLVDVARSLEGVSRNVSTHAAGVVIAPDELVRYTPLQFGPGRESVITQYDMKAVGEIGLLKMDFLGLQNLDIISSCVRLIEETRREKLDIEKIPLGDDPKASKAYDLISAADTHGVFQLEGSGMRRMLLEMRPQAFEDVAAAIALFRPGPMANIPAYLARKQGKERIEYAHPAMEPILRDTYGVMIYQEQVMMAARALAGFTLSEADILRAAMGKKDKVMMALQREQFVAGCVKNEISPALAESMFEGIAKFAEYAFNRAHSSAYGVISYQTAYLKANYPLEYMTSLLIHMEGSADRVATAIVDCKARGIAVHPPHINRSGADFSIVGNSILFGLAAIKNVGQKAVELIAEDRAANGEFKSLQDLCDRVCGVQEVNRRVLESLIRSGACDALGERNQLLLNLERALSRAESARRDRESGQTSLFGVEEVSGGDLDGSLEPAAPMSDEEKLRAEKELLGLYLSDHPLNRIEAELAKLVDTQAVEVTSELQDTEVRLAGLVRDVRRVVTRKGQIMAYAELEDLTGPFDVILFPRTYELYRQLFEPEKVLVIQGKVDARSGGGVAGRGGAPAQPSNDDDSEPIPEVEEVFERAAIIADLAWLWDDPECVAVERSQTVHIDISEAETDAVDLIAGVLARHPGSDPVLLHFHIEGREVIVQTGDRYHVAAGPTLVEQLDQVLGRRVTRLETVRPRTASGGNGNGRNGNGNGNGRSYRNGAADRG